MAYYIFWVGILCCYREQGLYCWLYVVEGVFAHFCNHNLWVVGGYRVLAVGKKLFVELLSGTQPRLFNCYVYVRYLSAKVYHLLCKVVDLYGLSHIKDINLSAVSGTSGL